MKKAFFLLTILVGTYAIPFNLNAQTTVTEVSQARLIGETVEFTVESTQKFYVGGNIHILHIGEKTFTHSKNGKNGAKSTLTFLIPLNDFNQLTDGTDVWMSYGNKVKKKNLQTMDIKKMCESSPKSFWYLGTFNHSILK